MTESTHTRTGPAGGDVQALVDALTDHQGAVGGHAYLTGGDASTVEDISQEVFAQATALLRSGEMPHALTVDSLRPWLLHLTEHLMGAADGAPLPGPWGRSTASVEAPAPAIDPAIDPAIEPDAYVEALRRDHGEHVRRYVLGMCRNAHLADDVTSETFERALRSARRDGVTHEVPVAWLKTIARNLLTDFYRRAINRHESAHAEPPEHAYAEAADARALRMESLRRLDAALDLLTPGQRRAIEMRTLDGYSTAEVAAEMGRSEQAVRSLIHKATRTLITHYRGLAEADPLDELTHLTRTHRRHDPKDSPA